MKFDVMIEKMILYFIISVVILTIAVFVAFFSCMCAHQQCQEYQITVGIGKTIVKTLKDFQTQKGYFPDNLKVVLTDEIQEKRPKILKMDLWGNLFVYRIKENQNNFLLYSMGANGFDELGQGDDIVINPNNVNLSKQFYCD